MTSNLSWNTPKKLYIKPTRLWVSLKGMLVPGTRKSFLVCPRPWLYPFWNMVSLSSHPIYRRTPDIDALERVQRRASKYTLPMSSRASPYEERLAMLGWSSPQSRRSYLSFLECYKTIHDLNGLTCNDYLDLTVMVKQDQTIHLN